jgi:hypothetical protein
MSILKLFLKHLALPVKDTQPLLSQVKLGVFCYIMVVQNTVHVL